VSFAANGRRAWTIAFAAVMLGFYLDMRFVATSRTAFAYFPILSILFAVKYLNRRHAVYFLLLAAVVEFGVLLSSPYMRDRIWRTVQDYRMDRDTSVDRGTNSAASTSNGLRLAYWSVSIRAISEAPFFGHGTGATQPLFSREAEGKSGEWATSSAIRITRRCTSRSSGACWVASSSMRCGASICCCFADPFLHHGSGW